MQVLSAQTEAAEAKFVEQAGHCHRCRADMGRRGKLCEHCVLDELLVRPP